MIGSSLYLGDRLEDFNGNFDLFFSSLHYPLVEDNLSFIRKLSKICRKFEKVFCVDLNRKSLEDFPEILREDIILRLDFGFSTKQIADLSQKYQLALNASTIREEDLKDLMEQGANFSNILAWHNFYPLEYSGMGEEYFLDQNVLCKSFGMRVVSFVGGNENLRGPIYKGLVSLESHRGKNPYMCFLDMSRHFSMDNIVLSEGVDQESLSFIFDYYKNGRITIPVFIYDEEFKEEGFVVRQDISPYIIRNNRKFSDVQEKEPKDLKRGDLVVCNNKLGRYSGELEILKKDLGKDPTRNYLGSIDGNYLGILDLIKGGDELVFYRK